MNSHLHTALALLAISGSLAAQTSYDLFAKEFTQALRFNNESGMEKAIRSRPAEALTHFEGLLRRWLTKRDDADNNKLIAQMKTMFKKTMEADTLEHFERFYSGLDQRRLNLVLAAEQNRTKLNNQWAKAVQERDRKGVKALVEDGRKLGRQLEEVGHRIEAANVFSTLGTMLYQMPDRQKEDLIEAMDVVKMFLDNRKAWNWTKDTYYAQWSNWLKRTEIELKDEGKKAEDRKKAGLKEGAVGLAKFVDTKQPALVAKLAFHELKALPIDSTPLGGDVPVNWMSTSVLAGPSQMLYFKEKALYLVRQGAAKLGVSLSDASGAPVQKVEVGGKPKPSLFYLDKEHNQPYSMVFFVGGQATPYAATTSNMSPQKDSMTVYYRSTASWTATLDGVEIALFDDNCDGKLFTEDPLAYGYKTRMTGQGPKEEVPLACYDSMQIGKRGRIVPFSSCAKIGEKWYMLSAADHGKAIEAKPLHPDFFKIGTISMKWSGPVAVQPQLLIIRGRDGLQSAAFNIAGVKSVEVPEGTYEIVFGRGTRGKGAQIQMTHVYPGDSKPIKVEAGKETVVKLGAPFHFDFVRGGSGDDVELDSLRFRVLGASGEMYGRIHGPTPAPEVLVAKTSSGRGAKVVGSYVPIASPDLLNTAADTLGAILKKDSIRGMGIEVGYFPVVKGSAEGSTRLKFKSPITGGLVGLRVKKHKMFGKIDPVFK
ncbi:MAG: hypothetical protein KDC87_03950 [Planctomycetes bacterium]|nr:hypothetical protein [Planctomycetota bacterium]